MKDWLWWTSTVAVGVVVGEHLWNITHQAVWCAQMALLRGYFYSPNCEHWAGWFTP